MDHHFNTQVAKDYDISIATLLQNIKHWTHINLANNRNIHDGLCWTYNSIKAFCELMDYWSRHQIEHLFSKCEKEGLIKSGNYNASKYDRTKWYALTPKAYQYFPELLQESYIESMFSTISENSEINFGEFRNQFRNFPRPIPDNKPDNKPDSISDLEKSPITTAVIEEVVSVYHEELPECPKIKVIGSRSGELCRLITKMINNWPKLGTSKNKFTIERFREYLKQVKKIHPTFLQSYTTANGNQRRNNLKTLIREDNILKFVNGEFNFK